jgi:hypothetical protein
MSFQNMPARRDYIAVSVQVTTTPANLQALIEAILGITPGSLATLYREFQIQLDPETSGATQVRFGNGNVGSTVGGVVQKGVTLSGGGASDTIRGPVNNVMLSPVWVQAVTGTAVLNIQLWSY